MEVNVIAEELGVKQHTISKTLERAVETIIKQYEEDYENWYYLNIRKGVYKTCSRCGKTKLISRFDKEKTGRYGVRGYCKNCYNRKK